MPVASSGFENGVERGAGVSGDGVGSTFRIMLSFWNTGGTVSGFVGGESQVGKAFDGGSAVGQGLHGVEVGP
ncbi:UNVERIFIED_ORG: hypothetical protein ABIB52_001899 [Arthrobacter sp. UYCu721]